MNIFVVIFVGVLIAVFLGFIIKNVSMPAPWPHALSVLAFVLFCWWVWQGTGGVLPNVTVHR